MPLIVPTGELAGVLAADESRCCLREWLARVPDLRSPLGRRHPLVYVLTLTICAFTAAGHDCSAAVAEWVAGCSQDTLAVLGGRRDSWTRWIRSPGVRTFSRVFGHVDAEAFNAALYGHPTAMPASPPGALPAVTQHEHTHYLMIIKGYPEARWIVSALSIANRAWRGSPVEILDDVVLDGFVRALDGFEAVLAGVAPDRWGAPSPCEGWCAVDVAGHVIGELRAVEAYATGHDEIDSPADPRPSGDDPVAAWRRGVRRGRT